MCVRECVCIRFIFLHLLFPPRGVRAVAMSNGRTLQTEVFVSLFLCCPSLILVTFQSVYLLSATITFPKSNISSVFTPFLALPVSLIIDVCSFRFSFHHDNSTHLSVSVAM